MNETYSNFTESIESLLNTAPKHILEMERYAQKLADFQGLLTQKDTPSPTATLRIQLLLLKVEDLKKRMEILKSKQENFLNDLQAALAEQESSRNSIFLNLVNMKLKTETFNFLQLFSMTEKEIRDLEVKTTKHNRQHTSAHCILEEA